MRGLHFYLSFASPIEGAGQFICVGTLITTGYIHVITFLLPLIYRDSWCVVRCYFLILLFLIGTNESLCYFLASFWKVRNNSVLIVRAIAQAVSRRLPTAVARVQTRLWSCGILWWTKVALGQDFSENFGLFPLHNLHSICFSTIIFTITRGCHNRPGLAAVPIASQTRI
jgi:hypothetical protein